MSGPNLGTFVGPVTCRSMGMPRSVLASLVGVATLCAPMLAHATGPLNPSDAELATIAQLSPAPPGMVTVRSPVRVTDYSPQTPDETDTRASVRALGWELSYGVAYELAANSAAAKKDGFRYAETQVDRLSTPERARSFGDALLTGARAAAQKAIPGGGTVELVDFAPTGLGEYTVGFLAHVRRPHRPDQWNGVVAVQRGRILQESIVITGSRAATEERVTAVATALDARARSVFDGSIPASAPDELVPGRRALDPRLARHALVPSGVARQLQVTREVYEHTARTTSFRREFLGPSAPTIGTTNIQVSSLVTRHASVSAARRPVGGGSSTGDLALARSIEKRIGSRVGGKAQVVALRRWPLVLRDARGYSIAATVKTSKGTAYAALVVMNSGRLSASINAESIPGESKGAINLSQVTKLAQIQASRLRS